MDSFSSISVLSESLKSFNLKFTIPKWFLNNFLLHFAFVLQSLTTSKRSNFCLHRPTTHCGMCNHGLCNTISSKTIQVSSLIQAIQTRCGPEACLATKTANVVSWSNDYQKLIDLMTFHEALNHLASVASICAHSHHEGPEAFSYEWHPCSSLINWAQRHIIEICRSFFFLKDVSPRWKLCALKRPCPQHWAVEKNHLWLVFQLNCHG